MLVVGDLHFDDPVRYQAGDENLYLDRVSEGLWHVLQIAEEGECVIFLGDFFEKKDRIRNKVKNRLLQILEKGLKKKDLSYVFVAGNHDWNKEGECSIEFLKGYGVLVKKLKVLKIEDKRVLCVPWNLAGKFDLSGFEGNVDVVAGHLWIKGIELGNGIVDNGEDFEVYEMGELLRLGRLVLAGHYHRHQIIGGRIFVVGSMVQVDFGEAGEKKYVVRVKDKEICELIELPCFVNREIIKISEDKDLVELSGREDLGDKFVRFDGDVEKVNVEDLKKVLNKKSILWYELNLIRDSDRDKFNELIKVKEKGVFDLKRFIEKSLEMVEEGKREVFRNVIEEGCG